MIYHLTGRDDWTAAGEGGFYTAPSLASQGFIHFSATPEQVRTVANALYRGRRDLVILIVDPDRLGAELRYEPPDPTVPADHAPEEQFPHLYGPLELAAVIRIAEYPCSANGSFPNPPPMVP